MRYMQSHSHYANWRLGQLRFTHVAAFPRSIVPIRDGWLGAYIYYPAHYFDSAD
jgi:hypothetical protein